MISTLYDKFKDWSKTGSVYIYSDPHFDDEDCKIMDKNWITPTEQINIINKFVHKCDTLILLGDVGNKRYISQLKAGHKVLIMGNHDDGASNYKRNKIFYKLDVEDYTKQTAITAIKNDCPWRIVTADLEYDITSKPFKYWGVVADNNLFDEVYEGPLMISEKIILSHEPIQNINWALNIHGHNHSGFNNDDYHYNVCSNTINFTPVNLSDIIKSGKLKNIDSLHRLTIDHATERSLRKK